MLEDFGKVLIWIFNSRIAKDGMIWQDSTLL